MLKYSEGLRNALMVAGSLKSLLTGCHLRIYSGSVPNSPDEALPGDAEELVTLSADGSGINFEASATNGTLTKSTSEVWSGVAGAAGKATFFRLCQTSDSGLHSNTLYRVQGIVGIAGADMHLTNPTLVAGATQTLDYFYLTMPEA